MTTRIAFKVGETPHPLFVDGANEAPGAGMPSWMAPRVPSLRPLPNFEQVSAPVVLDVVRSPSSFAAPLRPPSEGVSAVACGTCEVHERSLADQSGEIGALRAEVDRLRSEANELKVALAVLGEGATRLRQEVLEQSEQDLVHLAFTLAERMVGRAVEVDPSLVVRWAREGILGLSDRENVTVVVSSDIAQRVPQAVFEQAFGETCTVERSSELPPQSCEIRGKFARIDGSVRARIRAMAETLGVDAE